MDRGPEPSSGPSHAPQLIAMFERSDAALDALVERCRGLLTLPGDPACVALFQGFGAQL